MSMTIEEADAKAKELYGSQALAKFTAYGAPDIVIENDPFAGVNLSLGWGDTWEEAFAMAAERVEWHHFCDITPAHGRMQIEPMYGIHNEILQYGWFCAVKDCDGYGGPAPGPKQPAKQPAKKSKSVKRYVQEKLL